MPKRNLNRRQQWRVQKIQEERTKRAEKRERDVSRQQQSGELSSEQLGLIISHYGQHVDVEALEGQDQGVVHRCHVRANIESLVTGDKVIWRAGADYTGVIEARAERESVLQRPDNFGQIKPVAANIDFILLVIAPEPEPFCNLIDRYLVACETTEITPILLLNKTDLLNDDNREPILSMLARYDSLGYQTLQASTTTEHGLDELLDILKDRTSVFVGQSGVGKSSLIKALMPEQDIRIGDLSAATSKGTHTTTTAKLFHMPCGGDLVDSPGIREFGLWHITQDELLEGFVEFRPHLGYCRFRDCKHKDEPGCAIRKACEDGLISEQRMDSFLRIRAAIAEQHARGLTLEPSFK
ncbi:MAG: small ribosomal subunit biogenesis GTPase RsgA [Hahellaceae bacterium]|nr:small ribosomal subunit biogenesis GTPase RsgA [Hahellaceae bacterium]MCP5169996.1 small ribosomal subunit biogenesis GTPase RsgA [Hahellaceae bacterium]